MSELIHIPVAFRTGTRLPAAVMSDPVAVHRAIAATQRPDGDLDIDDIVAAAEDPSSPLHPAIEWDDTKAAHRHRVTQAFYVLNGLLNTKTGEPVYVSRYRETNNAEDAGRIRINVRYLPPPDNPAPALSYIVKYTSTPERLATPPVLDRQEATQEVVDCSPENERSLNVFRRWVAAHKHNPAVLQAALRVLYDAL